MKKRVLCTLLMTSMVFGMTFTACGKKEAETEEVAVETVTPEATAAATVTPTVTAAITQAPVVELPAIGNKVGADWQITVNNKTGQDIISVTVCEVENGTETANLLTDQGAFLAMESRNLYLDIAAMTGTAAPCVSGTPEASSALSAAGLAADTAKIYSIKFTLMDGTVIVVNDIAYADIKQADICLENGVGYMSYKSVTNGADVTTQQNPASTGVQTLQPTTVQNAGTEQQTTDTSEDENTDDSDYSDDDYSDEDYSDEDEDYYEEENDTDEGSDEGDQSSDDADTGCIDDGLFY